MFRHHITKLLLLSVIVLYTLTGYSSDKDSQRQSSSTRWQSPPSSNRQPPFNRQPRRLIGLSEWPIKSKLPLVIVDTLGKWIPDEPKIPAKMKIIYDESGGRNFVGSNKVHFEGKIGIEVRGKTSQQFPKKQYGFKILDKKGQDLKISLLGMPADSDWILHGPYSDKSLMRNFLAYEFSNRIGQYATRTKFVEVFLKTTGETEIRPGDYVGVYLLMEKIKRSQDRVDIQALKPSDNKEPEITGGYIIKIDKVDFDDTIFSSIYGTQFILVYPDGNTITEKQKAWIQSYMNAFERTLRFRNFNDPKRGYAKYIDTASFIDHLIINEIFRNIDGLRLSTYIYKDRNKKLAMGPVWDFNLSMGNADYFEGWKPDGWMVYTTPVPFWWHQLLADRTFAKQFADRWRELRKDTLATAKIMATIDETVELLDEAQRRNFQRWPIFGQYIWPNPYPLPRSYEGEIKRLKSFLKARVEWIDGRIGTVGRR